MNEILDKEDFVEDSYVLRSAPGLGRPLKRKGLCPQYGKKKQRYEHTVRLTVKRNFMVFICI